MGFTADTPTVAGIVLLRSAIQSPNYVTAVSGWTINQDGSVEFTNGVFRGSLSAGGGNVLVNSTGVHVQGNFVQMDINSGAGFLVRALPADGSAGQLTVVSNAGGQLSLQPSPNAANPGITWIQAFYVVGTTVYSGTDVAGYVKSTSPAFSGSAAKSTIQQWGQSSGSATDNSVIQMTAGSIGITAGSIKALTSNGGSPTDLGYGVVATGVITSNGGGVTSGTQVTQVFATDLSNFTPVFAAGRAYRVEVTANVETSVLHADPVFEVHKATVGGQRFGSWRVGPGVINFPYVLTANCYFKVGPSANVTANILLSLGGSAGATVNVVAAADNPTTITIYDVGTAASFPNAPVIT